MEVDDEVFEKMRQEKMHKEMVKSLEEVKKAIVSISIPKQVDNSDKFEDLGKLLKEISDKLNKPNNFKLEVPKDNSFGDVKNLLDKVTNAINEIKKPETKKEWEFIVQRNTNGFITSVTAKTK